MAKKEFKKNEIIFSNSTVEDCMYDIISGKVGIYSDYSTDNEKELTVLYEGDAFGELGMIEKKPRSATAVALKNTTLEVITAEDFKEYFKDKPEKVKKILSNTSTRVRYLTRDYVKVCKAISDYVYCTEKGEPIDDDLMYRLMDISKIGK